LLSLRCFPISGSFEPPGAQAVAQFVSEYEKANDPRWQAVKVAQVAADKAKAETAKARKEAEMAAKDAARARAGAFSSIRSSDLSLMSYMHEQPSKVRSVLCFVKRPDIADGVVVVIQRSERARPHTADSTGSKEDRPTPGTLDRPATAREDRVHPRALNGLVAAKEDQINFWTRGRQDNARGRGLSPDSVNSDATIAPGTVRWKRCLQVASIFCSDLLF
jgi:hypothetical protein